VTRPVWDGDGRDPWLPARLDARLEAARVERDIRAAVWAALSDWLVQTSRRVLRGDLRGDLPPDPDAIWAMAPLWREAVDLILSGEVAKALALAFEKLLGSGNWTQRPAMTRYLAEVRNRLVRIPDEVYDFVAGQIAHGANLGESIPKLAARVDNVLSTTASERWPNRATVIARTECLPGDAVVNGAYATSAYRRVYSGPMVAIKTMGGRQFTGTPNHPVLTSDGWVGLGALLQGDHLICDSKSVQATGTPGDQDIRTGQTTIAQVFDAAQAVGITCREATAQPDFHGDGREGYVDVLRSFGVLPVGSFAAIGEGSVDLLLPPADAEKVALACLRAPFARSASVDEPTTLLGVPPRDTSGCHDSADGFDVPQVVGLDQGLGRLACEVPSQDLFFREVSAQSPVLSSPIEEVTAGIRQGPDHPALAEDSSHLVHPEPGPISDPPVAEPGQVELDEVVSIEVRDWLGHVYNLTTVQGYFVSGGIYTGNTIGALNASRTDAFAAVAEADPGTEYERIWLSTSDSRTRSTHRAVDGQRVALSSPFIVGGFPLAFPGDPTGPPQEIIQCRCVSLLVEKGESVDLSNRQMRGS
jgi:hypothetical protein